MLFVFVAPPRLAPFKKKPRLFGLTWPTLEADRGTSLVKSGPEDQDSQTGAPTAEAPAPYVDACLLFVAIRDTAETHKELMEKAKKTGAAFDSHPTRPPVYGFFPGGCDGQQRYLSALMKIPNPSK